MASERTLRLRYESLNGIGRKVIDAVPFHEDWSAVQISNELRRTGSTPDRIIVDGCLRRGVEDGLLREPHKGRFQAVHFDKVRPEKEESEMPQQQPPASLDEARARAQNLSISDKLAAIASKMRAAAKDIDDLAVAIEEADQSAQAQQQDMRTLQTLIQKIAGGKT